MLTCMTARNEIFLEIFAGQYKYHLGLYDFLYAYSTPHFLSYPKFDKFIGIYTFWKKNYE